MTEGGQTPAADDLVTCLCKAVCGDARPVRIVTVSRTPVRRLLAHAFGPAASINLIERRGDRQAGAATYERAGGADGSPAVVDTAAYAVLARFLDATVFERFIAGWVEWLAATAGVILQFDLADSHRHALAEIGLTEVSHPTAAGRPTSVFQPRREPPAPPYVAQAPRAQPPLRRLVIVDPCLGAAPGHYLGYAEALTRGATALGAEVVWACHAGAAIDLAPPGVTVRRCFARSFFDIDPDAVGQVDLSGEILTGWLDLLAAFDDPGTHFLAHSADAHQLRALVCLSETSAAPRSVIHVNCQTSPRFMPGRIAGLEAHRALFQIRTSDPWERRLFLWSETPRLGAWLSQWLGAPVPSLPFLLTSGPAAASVAKVAGPITLSFLGEARPAKGFFDLPLLMDQIAASPVLRDAVRVVIQSWPPFRADLRRHDETVARLRDHRFVEVVEGVMTPEDYRLRLSQTDIVLAPYHPETYALQGSGILVEALAQGAAILARTGTTAEDEADHGTVFAFDTADAFATVLAAMIADWADLSARSHALAARFREANTPDRYVAALDARARGQAAPRGSIRSRLARNHW